MDLELGGDTAVVIGGAQGIGRNVAEAFLEEDCRVALLDLSASVEETASVLGDRCLPFQLDVTDSAALDETVAACVAELGSINHVVHAAAIGSGKAGFPFWNLDPEDWQRVLEVNLIGAARCAHAFAPQLIQRRGNTILFFASVAAQIGSQTDPPYSASKAGVINFMQCVARDFAPYGARANAISPGMVRSSLNESVWAAVQANTPESERQDYEAWAQEKIGRISPLGQWQEAREFGPMAVYLASRHARNITGQTLNIDGGQVMHS